MKIATSTQMLGFNNLTTYYGDLDPDLFFSPEMIQDSFEEGEQDENLNYVQSNFKMHAFLSSISLKLESELNDNLIKELKNMFPNLISKFKFIKFTQPKEYNFTGDNFLFEITCKGIFIDALIKFTKSEKGLNEYLKNNFSSYDGFVSYFPDNIYDLVAGLETKDEYCINAILHYIIHVVLEWDFYYDRLRESYSQNYFEFVDWSYMNNAIDFIKDGILDSDYSGIDEEMQEKLIEKYFTK